KGLVTRTLDRPRRYLPATPDIALESLALQRQEGLQRARGMIQELQKLSAASEPQDRREQIVELITSREAERQIVEQMARTAREEVIALVRPPILISWLGAAEDQLTQREAQARGARSRSIVDQEFLALPGAVARVCGDIKAGEEVRVFPHLPFK